MLNPSKSLHAISKILSANDVGETGGHQAGILIPKDPRLLSFFPQLQTNTKNPRVHLKFTDDAGVCWSFAFIYYNNSQFGGTRNEYRLTRMTPYMTQNNLHPGDEIVLFEDSDGERHITYRRLTDGLIVRDGILRIGKEWKVIKVKEF